VQDLWQTKLQFAKFLGPVLSYIKVSAISYDVCIKVYWYRVLVPTYKYICSHTINLDLFNSFLRSGDFNMYFSLNVIILLNLSWINSTYVKAVLVLIVLSMHINLKFYLSIYLEYLITISILLLCKCSLILLLL